MRIFILAILVVAAVPSRSLSALQSPAIAAQRINAPGVLLTNAQVFILPDATRTPLATLQANTTVHVQEKQGDWYVVVFRDPVFGNRTGYMQTSKIRIDSPTPAAPPSSAAPAPPSSATPRTAARQPARTNRASRTNARGDRAYLSFNGLYQSTSNGFTSATTLTRNVEAGTVTTSYAKGRPPVVDVAATARSRGNLAVGVGVTWLSQSNDSAVSASIPHPFLFNASREVSGVAAQVPHKELAVHVDAAWIVPAGRMTDVALFAGPSFFHLSQTLVTDVAVTDVYPFDTATFVSATTTSGSASKLGFNAGIDVTAHVSRRLGIGFLARYSRASVRFPLNDAQEVVRAGGLQVGGGLRVGF